MKASTVPSSYALQAPGSRCGRCTVRDLECWMPPVGQYRALKCWECTNDPRRAALCSLAEGRRLKKEEMKNLSNPAPQSTFGTPASPLPPALLQANTGLARLIQVHDKDLPVLLDQWVTCTWASVQATLADEKYSQTDKDAVLKVTRIVLDDLVEFVSGVQRLNKTAEHMVAALLRVVPEPEVTADLDAAE